MSGLCDQVEPLLKPAYDDDFERAPILSLLLDRNERVPHLPSEIRSPSRADNEWIVSARPKSAHELVQIELQTIFKAYSLSRSCHPHKAELLQFLRQSNKRRNHFCLRMLKLQSKGLSHAQHILDHWRGRGRPNLAVFLRTALRRAFKSSWNIRDAV